MFFLRIQNNVTFASYVFSNYDVHIHAIGSMAIFKGKTG